MGRVIDTFDEMYDEPDAHHGTARACLNGHLITPVVEAEPAKAALKRCVGCGELAIQACPSCSSPLLGAYYEPENGYLTPGYRLPQFCHECGTEFEWTRRAVAAAAAAMRESGQVTAAEVEQFSRDLPEIAKETPNAVEAVPRTRALLGRLSASARSVVRDVLVQVLSDAVSGRIFPGR
jgi:hypothetical protein